MTDEAQAPAPAPAPPPFVPPPMPPMPPPPPPPPDPCRHCDHERSEHDDDGVCLFIDDEDEPCQCPGFEPEPERNEQGEELHVEILPSGGRIVTVLRPAPEPPPVTAISPLDFLQRFTDAEAVAIDLASIVQAATVRRLKDLIAAATVIRLDSERTMAGVQMLEGRAAEILDPFRT